MERGGRESTFFFAETAIFLCLSLHIFFFHLKIMKRPMQKKANYFRNKKKPINPNTLNIYKLACLPLILCFSCGFLVNGMQIVSLKK